MRFVQSTVIWDFDAFLDVDALGEQNSLHAMGHSLDEVIREMTISLWYDGNTVPTTPDPTGWLQFQLVQPKKATVVRAYPDGYNVLAESPRLKFTDIAEFQPIRVRSQGGTTQYMEVLFVVGLGYKSGSGVDAVWDGLEAAVVSLNYKEEDRNGS